MKFNRVHYSIRISLVIALLFVLLSVGFMPAIAQTGTDWQKANGGWIVIGNSHQYGTGAPFQSCPGQTGCRGLSLHVEHGVCINAVTLANPTTGASWTPPTNNIILAQDCGTNEAMRVSCPVVTKYWVPAGTYTLTEFTFVSEVNTDPNYIPCDNAWSKPSKTVAINPGDTVDFGDIFIGTGTCTVGGYPCPGGPLPGIGAINLSKNLGGNWSGEAISNRSGKTWPFKLTLIGPDMDGSISGQIEWLSLDSIHKIAGSETTTGITFTETAYIKKGGAVLNCKYYLNFEGNSLTGKWDSCDDGDYGTISMKT